MFTPRSWPRIVFSRLFENIVCGELSSNNVKTAIVHIFAVDENLHHFIRSLKSLNAFKCITELMRLHLVQINNIRKGNMDNCYRHLGNEESTNFLNLVYNGVISSIVWPIFLWIRGWNFPVLIVLIGVLYICFALA